jgi:hypothetical protein
MLTETKPHAYPKGGMGLCPFCGKSKINKIHVSLKCSSLVKDRSYVFRCNYSVKETCPNCIKPFCARHINKHRCE